MPDGKMQVELFHGKDFEEREEEFNQALYEIELTHLDFFKSQEPHDESEKHVLHNELFLVHTPLVPYQL